MFSNREQLGATSKHALVFNHTHFNFS